ncbi:E3 SUMO-protein ligase ZBED1 [Frankliniella fusca]|uniref:E3 SUMO-protein ligase ZBED1 n=1 Tax=Frankliniella fusca TaxID=407009 RepID=A0AAE1LSN7_9NEOP|nr:E3 SUMO-protein ligase ZBED1 [Frankliniella fusca]
MEVGGPASAPGARPARRGRTKEKKNEDDEAKEQVKLLLQDGNHHVVKFTKGITRQDVADVDVLITSVEMIARKHDNNFTAEDFVPLHQLTTAAVNDSPIQQSMKFHLRATILEICRVLQVIKKAKEIVCYMRASGLNQKLEGGTLKLEVNGFLAERNKAALSLNDSDLAIMDDMIPLLEVFERAVEAFEAEKQPTVQHVLPQFKLLTRATSPKPTDSPTIANLRRLMAWQLKDKFAPNITMRQKLGTLFSPQFKSLANLLSAEEIAEVHALQDADSSDDEYATLVDAPTPETVVKDEVDMYVELSVTIGKNKGFDLLQWWKEHEKDFPILSHVVRMILATPASSAASERHFSTAGHLITDRRTRLAPDTVNAILFLHDFLKKSGVDKLSSAA